MLYLMIIGISLFIGCIGTEKPEGITTTIIKESRLSIHSIYKKRMSEMEM